MTRSYNKATYSADGYRVSITGAFAECEQCRNFLPLMAFSLVEFQSDIINLRSCNKCLHGRGER